MKPREKHDVVAKHCDKFIHVLTEFTETQQEQVNLIHQFAATFAQNAEIENTFNPLIQHLFLKEFLS